MNKKYLLVTIFLAVLLAASGIYALSTKNKEISLNGTLQTLAPSATIEPSAEPTSTSSATKIMDKVTELQIIDEKIGTGDPATVGKSITVNYAGTLQDGTKFDSSYDRGTPFTFTLGAGEVIKGWDEGFAGMKVGGKRKLMIPSSMAYGDNGIPGAIPGGATLIFEVELLKVE